MELYNLIKEIADGYAFNLQKQVDLRIAEMENDDNAHYL